MTRWSLFLQTLSLLHHFLGLYYEHTGKVWWLVLIFELVKLVARFAVKRRHRCKARKGASSPAHSDDDSL